MTLTSLNNENGGHYLSDNKTNLTKVQNQKSHFLKFSRGVRTDTRNLYVMERSVNVQTLLALSGQTPGTFM
ncbi:Uncharacterized protein dnm_041910 [Desulfonema magnum]|uniref:Uncharacterized protein n=1 Tax=Desulfonema magnum TaxID=45655 RepID=A0A975GNN2_9BACT|nr:Uncharacterized protein dnm_041910 [Desulfonema magnum]